MIKDGLKKAAGTVE